MGNYNLRSGLGTFDDIDYKVFDINDDRHGRPTHRMTGITFRVRVVWSGSITAWRNDPIVGTVDITPVIGWQNGGSDVTYDVSANEYHDKYYDYAHAHAHAQTHMRTCARTLMRTPARANAHTHTHSHACACAQTHTYAHT